MDEVRSIVIWTPHNVSVVGEFLLWDQSPTDPDAVRLELSFGGKQLTAESDVGYFDALCKIWAALEPNGYRLFCFGASKGVYPSGMSRSMGAGDKAYRLEMGKAALAKDLVSIFDSDASVVPVTVEDQRAFFEEWLESLRKMAP